MTRLTLLPNMSLLALMPLLAACTSLSPAGLLAARKLDPVNTPPADIAVAVGVPQTLRLGDGDASFRLAFSGGTPSATVRLDETVPLRIAASDGEGPAPNAPGEAVYVARIAPADAGRIAAVQREIRQLRASGMTGQGSLSISVTGGCLIGPAPDILTVSTWLQTDPAEGFVALTRRQDIARAIGENAAGTLRAQLRPCPRRP